MADDRHVRRSGSDYAQAFLALLPFGQAWPRHPLSTLVLTVNGLANYWGTVDGRAADLLELESFPTSTTQLLPDWERNWGLPDSCMVNPPSDLIGRRAALVAKITMIGAQSRQWFIDVAASFGYTITISENSPYMCGVSRCGDQRGIYNPDDPTRYHWQLGPPEIRYYWTVHTSAKKITKFHVASSVCGIDRLTGIVPPEDLECILNRWKPAHTEIVFDFATEALDFTQPLNSQYLPMGVP